MSSPEPCRTESAMWSHVAESIPSRSFKIRHKNTKTTMYRVQYPAWRARSSLLPENDQRRGQKLHENARRVEIKGQARNT